MNKSHLTLVTLVLVATLVLTSCQAVHTGAGCCAVHCRANIRSSFIADTDGYGGIKAIPII